MGGSTSALPRIIPALVAMQSDRLLVWLAPVAEWLRGWGLLRGPLPPPRVSHWFSVPSTAEFEERLQEAYKAKAVAPSHWHTVKCVPPPAMVSHLRETVGVFFAQRHRLPL